ncbi:NAD(P)H-hydrate epimerase [Paralcaligenes ureilyticus]|uniref:Bifunctional NAD(P)H-hydrate repair enzyme n=2 Tax=Paralcaligenes ureilyticus TaxID=627131 RepID=A0A4R3LV12_9BURK|nr:NAD(P)H-hydrate epimerase [Paralcaligenes ureilyticus]
MLYYSEMNLSRRHQAGTGMAMNSIDRALLTPLEMKAADVAALKSGISGVTLMEAAGQAVAEAVSARWPMQPVVVLCGLGNNGGDGFVAARRLAQMGWPVRLGLLGARERLAGDAAYCAALWPGAVEPLSLELLDGAVVVIDALFGSGLSRPVEGQARAVIETLIRRRLPVCAVDVPSGLDGESGGVRGVAAPANVTVTFFRKKPGHLLMPGKQLCGELVVADIGLPAAVLQKIAPHAYENGPEIWLEDYPWPQMDSHKYQRGHAVVVGGAEMTGASRLSAMAAARVGAGLVTLAAPDSAWAIYAAALTSVMVRSLKDPDSLAEMLADTRKNAILIGPGAGVSGQTRQNVLEILATQRGVVLDADALTSFGRDSHRLFAAIAGPCVLTPHEGEFERLFPCEGNKLARTRYAARESGAVVLLKGPDTVIAAPDGRAIINSNAPADLATGGSGDVLSGLIVGLMAQGMEAFLAAAAAAWLHGEAASAFGPGLIAEDLPDALPSVLRRLKARKT